MKNKFLLFSLLFIFGLLIYFHSQISFAAITSVTTGAPSVGKTSVTLNGTANLGGASELYNRRGFNLGTATASGGNYNMGSSSDTGGPWAGTTSFTHATTSLSKGTAYYFRGYAASSTVPQLVYGSEVTFLTGIDEPASLAKTAAAEGSINLSWTKGAGAGNTYVRHRTDQYPTSITDGSHGCISSGASCSVDDLKCGSTYYLGAWSSTSAAGLSTTSDSYAQLTDSTGRCSGGGGRTLMAPTVYADSLKINNGAKSTAIREVELSLKAAEALHVTISNDTFFLNPLETYSATRKWTLTEGDGVKTVYVKFISQDGLNSDIVSNTIILETPPITPIPIPLPASEPAPAFELTLKPTPAPAEKPISEMTKEELTAKIAEILAQLEVLKTQLTESKEAVAFENNLKYGDRGDKVVKLQEVLIGQGLLAQDLNTGWFGALTKAAVIRFQEKYASEILIPSGLAKGTGFVGSATRVKLNALLGK